jgi:hypothetical protein
MQKTRVRGRECSEDQQRDDSSGREHDSRL